MQILINGIIATLDDLQALTKTQANITKRVHKNNKLYIYTV
jgi:hypothetical protein